MNKYTVKMEEEVPTKLPSAKPEEVPAEEPNTKPEEVPAEEPSAKPDEKSIETQKSDDKASDTKSKQADVANNVKEFGQTTMPEKDKGSDIHCLTIIGQVEGQLSLPPQNKTTKYEHLVPQIVGICEDPKIKGVLIILNTVGGDVESGLALAELLASINKPTVSLVLGSAHSIGVPISVASDYAFITPTGSMTIHPVRMSGTVIGVSQTFEFLEQMQSRIVDFVERNSNISAARFKELMLAVGNMAMDVGTVLVGQQAVDEKIIDEVGGLKDAIKKLHELIDKVEKEK